MSIWLSKDGGQFIKKLIDREELRDISGYISYDEDEHTLFISFSGMVEMVAVFSVEL